MTRILLFLSILLLSKNAVSQNFNLSEYSFVIVPEQFDFLKYKDEYNLNSMTAFYFNKNGFNAYMATAAPAADRCAGLYANVEEAKTLFGTKLQIVLNDCNGVEIYRSQEGKSKYKEYIKSYQDALRKAFNSIELLDVNQKEFSASESVSSVVKTTDKKISEPNILNNDNKIAPNSAKGNTLPQAKFSTYSNLDKTYLLRKTSEGYSLYQETETAENGLLLKGKIIVMEAVVKFIDTNGKVFNASFDAKGNLSITDEAVKKTFRLVD